ncbi:hypothetical protein UVI_02032410 [Ustilaginoidea virens]|uniref:Uncharacterized protein n=1 Tax=Ustilaginoidea virens TaxID=1159556 RepID=A0A1B5KVF9_USTVR|nr:hypothetical protein UVI_02032410 [Ustilaginoidea virens]
MEESGWEARKQKREGANIPTMPNKVVKTWSRKLLEKPDTAVPHPRSRAAAAGLGQAGSVTKAGLAAL